MLRACGLVCFRREGGARSTPPPLPDLPGCMLGYGFGMDFGRDTHDIFFLLQNPYQTRRAWYGWEG
ncbi:unnamed protein product, partial [Staurois parvus]